MKNPVIVGNLNPHLLKTMPFKKAHAAPQALLIAETRVIC